MMLAGTAAASLLRNLTAATVVLVGLSAGPALAQQAGSPFVGFTQNRDEPINFEADRAEVFDNEKRAVLSGNVRIQQGESTLQTARLVIFYEDTSSSGQAGRPATTTPREGQAAQGQRQGQSGNGGPTQNVRRFEMQGGVIVRSKNQTATADRGSFDARRNEAIMEGNVVLTQCDNVLRGARLHADLTANRVRVDAAPSGGRVSGILQGGGNAGGGSNANNPDCTPTRPQARSPRG